jgi:hypothetical protein
VLFDEAKGEIELDAGFKTSCKVLKEVVDVLMEKCHFPARNILFLGFGQGAMAALAAVVAEELRALEMGVDRLKGAFAEVEYVKWEKADDGMMRNREEMLPVMKFFARRLRSRAGVPEGGMEVG